MTCKAPRHIHRNNLGEEYNGNFWVPCGKCIFCRMKKVSEWSLRVMHEYETSDYQGVFITLTYQDKIIDGKKFSYQNENVRPEHLKDFWKRLRINYPNKIKYIACGEYGDLYGRPHYHACVIGMKNCLENKSIINKSWGFGDVHTENVCYETVKYIMDYLHKKHDQSIVRGRDEPFHRVSKGMGAQYAQTNMAEIIEKGGITTNNGKIVTIPRYYLKKFLTNGELDEITARRGINQYYRQHTDVSKMNNHYDDEVLKHKEQKELNMRTKSKLQRIRDIE